MKKYRFEYGKGLPFLGSRDLELNSLIEKSSFVKSYKYKDEYNFRYLYETTNLEALNYMIIKKTRIIKDD